MAPDYTIAGRWAEHVHAFAIIESNETDNQIGDGGRAFGILQQHPAFVLQWYRDIDVTDTWVTAQIKAARNFLDHYVSIFGLDLTVMAYNLGVSAIGRGERNQDYLNRWTEAFNRVKGAQNVP